MSALVQEEPSAHHISCQNVCVDAHTHLTDPVLLKNIDSIIQTAKANGVKAAVVVTESASDFDPVLGLYHRYPDFVLPCFGIHPIQSTGVLDENGINIKRSVTVEDYEGIETTIEKSLDIIGGIGEVGLDFTPRFCNTSEEKDNQRLIFSKQIQFAKKHDLSVNVHSRSAGNHAIQLLKDLGADKVLLHAFDGKASTAVAGASCGFYFSVTASVCRDPQVQKMVKSLPLDRLLVETDSPAIAPVKGETNEPSNVKISCEQIANIKKIDVEHVKQITTENAIKLFPKLTSFLNR